MTLPQPRTLRAAIALPALGLALAFALVLGAAPAPASAFQDDPAPAPALAEPTEVGKPRTTKSGLKYETLKPGDGAQAKPGARVAVHYVGTLADGSKFDSSRDRGTPFRFELGARMVIKGWDEGVAGMRIGETRKLTIPSALGYGPRGVPGVIPPDATLVFEVELLEIR